MNRRELYAAGLPFGECATAPKAGGGYVCGGGGGSSKSSSTSNTTTTVTDRRIVADAGAIGLSSDNSTINIQTLDAGIVGQALDTVNVGVTGLGEGFESLLNLAGDLFSQGGELIKTTQEQATSAVEAINTAANDREGSIDQKTMIVLAVAGAVAAFAFKKG